MIPSCLSSPSSRRVIACTGLTLTLLTLPTTNSLAHAYHHGHHSFAQPAVARHTFAHQRHATRLVHSSRGHHHLVASRRPADTPAPSADKAGPTAPSLFGSAPVSQPESTIPSSGAGLPETAAQAWNGKASYYWSTHITATGGHVGAYTCAHRSLPFGTKVRVINLATNRSVDLTVNDRGPFVKGRIIDVSLHAAQVLGMVGSGVAPVRLIRLASR